MEKRRCWKKAALPGTPASTDTLPLLSLPRACARQQWQYHNKPASQTEQTYRCWQRQPAAWQLAAHPACAGPRGQSAVRLRPPPASEWGWCPRPPRLARSDTAVYVCPHRAPPRAGGRRAWGERGRDSRGCRGCGRRKSPGRFRRRRVGDASAVSGALPLWAATSANPRAKSFYLLCPRQQRLRCPAMLLRLLSTAAAIKHGSDSPLVRLVPN